MAIMEKHVYTSFIYDVSPRILQGMYMRKAIATVVRVAGHCSVGYKSGDTIIVNLNNACIDKEQSDNLCIFSLNAILTKKIGSSLSLAVRMLGGFLKNILSIIGEGSMEEKLEPLLVIVIFVGNLLKKVIMLKLNRQLSKP